jgi:hypothetical protein
VDVQNSVSRKKIKPITHTLVTFCLQPAVHGFVIEIQLYSCRAVQAVQKKISQQLHGMAWHTLTHTGTTTCGSDQTSHLYRAAIPGRHERFARCRSVQLDRSAVRVRLWRLWGEAGGSQLLCLSGSPNSSWLARGRSASGASLSASRNLHSGIKAEIGLFAESRLAPRTIH